jgi:rhodanese-related sulfurtransferase
VKVEWKDLTPTEAFDHLKYFPDMLVLDVGQDALAGFRFLRIPLDDLELIAETLCPSSPYLIVSADGSASLKACARLAELGFEHLHNLQGGVEHWRATGLAERSRSPRVGKRSGHGPGGSGESSESSGSLPPDLI